MIKQLLKNAKNSVPILADLNTSQKNKIIQDMAASILLNSDLILQANQKDMQKAKESNLDDISLNRLFLTKQRVKSIAEKLLLISSLDDPVGNILESWTNKDHLKIEKVSVPIGVIAVIYESRPNVTSDTAALCFKSGNVCILKGGKEANYSNQAIAKVLQDVLEKHDLPREIISFLEHWKRDDLRNLIQEDKYIDLVIPRGGSELNQFVSKNASIPIIQQDRGLCHVYIHEKADISKAIEVALNSKCEHPAVCNAAETLLIDKNISAKILPSLHELFIQADTKLKGCKDTQSIIQVEQADEKDFDTEYLDNILNIKIVNNIEEAISHINQYSTHHSEAIITEDAKATDLFMHKVDASCVYLNTSTKFTDGSTFEMGAEVGISTSKLHARGPIGLKALTIYKYKIYGDGQIKVDWLDRFGYKGLFSTLIFGALLSFIPFSLLMLPIGYFSNLNDVPLLLTLLGGIISIYAISTKKPTFKILHTIMKKNENFASFIHRHIKGLEQFSSLPSALSKMPAKGIMIYKILNTTFWVSIMTLVGYALA